MATWNPWVVAELVPVGTTLLIAAPPCPTCLYWRPVVAHDGVVLCHKSDDGDGDMVPDFSCFRPKD